MTGRQLGVAIALWPFASGALWLLREAWRKARTTHRERRARR